QKHLETPGVLQVQRHGALVAVQILEIRAVARAAGLFPAGILQQRIDLDDIGAPVGELAHAGRSGTDAGEVEHGEAGQGLGSAGKWHFFALDPGLHGPVRYRACLCYRQSSFWLVARSPNADVWSFFCRSQVSPGASFQAALVGLLRRRQLRSSRRAGPAGADMSKGGSHLLGNSIWNASSFFVSVALNLLVLPFVLYRLGANAFGIASLVTACTAPALAFSNALALSTTREFAARLATEDREEAKQMFATALFVGIGAGLAIAAVLGLLAPPLAARVFHLEGSGVDLTLAFLLGAGGWFCQCLSVVFVALFTARQDYSRVATTGVISVIVATIAIVVL